MDIIVKSVSRVLFPFVLLFGVYIAVHGHLGPGGAFPAGTVIATGFALLVIAYTEADVEHRLTKHELIDMKSVAGIILVVLILNIGYVSRFDIINTQTFFELWSGGFTPFLNFAGMFMVITALVMIVYTMVRE
jgi:multicomponent Na+:H+ antiporter subunit B